MKTNYWFLTLPVIILVAVMFLVQKNQYIETETIAVSPTGASIDSPAESARTPDKQFTLRTIADDGKLVFQGVGGEIDGIVNPDLIVKQGDIVQIVLINGDGMIHDLFLPELNAKTDYVKKLEDQTELVFEVGEIQPGTYVYYCTLPGHRKAGQEGKLIIESSE